MRGLAAVAAVSALAASLVAQDPVERTLRSLSVEQKAGQLIMVWSLARVEGDNHERLLAAVREVGLGGVILSLGSTADAATLIPRLQQASGVPLWIASDFEGGVWYRLRGATELGTQMLVGASGSAVLAEAMGRITGDEAKALGFHLVFAPVLDVNNNPDNPIVNVRSFGEDPDAVGRLGAAFARGVRAAGLLPCGKHFPGHGDVATDSHLSLPIVHGDAARLRAVELRPFAAAAKDGLEVVMTGHLAVPALDPKLTAATLSPTILGDVLRGELGFTGLVVTDALDMGGVRSGLSAGEVAWHALAAGADVLLMPPDPLAARASIVDAVDRGLLPMSRLDAAVRRVLQCKAKVGLFDGRGQVAPDWAKKVRTAAAEAVADQIAAAGITLAVDRNAVLPLRPEVRSGALLVELLDKDIGQGRVFAEALRAIVAEDAVVRLSGDSTVQQVATAVERVRAANPIVLAIDARVRESQGRVGLPPALQPVLDALSADKRVVAVSFGDPYVGRSLGIVDAFVCAFAATERVERHVAAVLRGEAPCTGRLPVTIPGLAAVGDGLSQLVGTDVPRATPRELDVAPELPDRLRDLLAAAVADDAFPGAVCLVARHGAQIAEVVVGREGYSSEDPPMRADTLFDLASLTKVCATTPAVLRLVAAGRMSLDDRVDRWVPAFVGVGKERVTIRHLLAHCGGLSAHERYHGTLRGKDAIVAAMAAEPLQYEPGSAVVYSDLGFALLMAAVERCSDEPFAAFVQREVWTPLGMAGARFARTDAPALDAAPTEDDPQRGGIVRGHAHDENAFAMGGVSGHAGMFGTADDVLRLGLAMLGSGRGVLPHDLVGAAIRPAGIGEDRTRGLGFEMLTNGGFGGTVVPARAFGHTGFTGTSLWCDPVHDLCVVLLTNRVHPTRVNGKIGGVRRAVHDLVQRSLR